MLHMNFACFFTILKCMVWVGHCLALTCQDVTIFLQNPYQIFLSVMSSCCVIRWQLLFAVLVPERALVLDWVFTDGPPQQAVVYDNNHCQDFHAIVPKSIPEELFWVDEEDKIYRKLQEERRLREEAIRAKVNSSLDRIGSENNYMILRVIIVFKCQRGSKVREEAIFFFTLFNLCPPFTFSLVLLTGWANSAYESWNEGEDIENVSVVSKAYSIHWASEHSSRKCGDSFL